MANGNKLTIRFLHPRSSEEFPAEVGTSTTGQKALDELAKAGFIDQPGGSRAYVLHHQKTGKTIPLSAALAASGVADGDAVAVTETSAGAGR